MNIEDMDKLEKPKALIAGLIGLGWRSCKYVRQLHQALSIESCAFLIDHDPESLQEDSSPAYTTLINHVEIVPDFSVSDVMGVVIVGAEHQKPSEILSLKLGLQKERPALLLGIVLPSPKGEPVRINSEFLMELDCVIWWPGDLALPEWCALLKIVVSDWLAPVLKGGLVCMDLGDILCLFCGSPQPILMASASAPLEQPQVATHTALASLYEQGFKPDLATGLLIVVRGGLNIGITHFENAVYPLLEILSKTVTVAAALPIDIDLKDCLRVTLFSASIYTSEPHTHTRSQPHKEVATEVGVPPFLARVFREQYGEDILDVKVKLAD
jgi:hypothetical protein